ncbi:DciA family protein [Streptomyces cyaneofuscatus]|uniref:DciA family protein n=1 Tax=Streptomyces cyaneofuscatus TaxID=66883 RepID=UPI0037BB719F
MSDSTPNNPASGVDLARVALRNARAAAKAAPQKPRRTGAAASRQARSGEREPQSLGTAISRMMAERGLESGTAAGTVRRTVLSQWAAIAPEFHGKVQAVQYDPATRTLHLRPCSAAYRTQLILHQRQIVARVNAAAGADPVTALKILPPGATDLRERLHPGPAAESAALPAARPPVERQRNPRPRDPGYLAALTAHQQTWDGRQETNPLIRAKAERQIRERIREPEHRFVEKRRAHAGRRAALDAADRSASSDAARARALKRLAEERAAAARADRPAEPS